MTTTGVGYHCGTINCCGGWYVVAKSMECGTCAGYFTYGIKFICEDLGFPIDFDVINYNAGTASICYWAKDNPSIWGNNEGQFMFNDKHAFYHPTKRPEGALNLRHIIDHWTEVAERVKALEAQQTRMDITKSLAVIPVDEKLDAIIHATLVK